MREYRKKYDEDFKKNAVKLSYANPKTVREITEALGIHGNLLYNWRKKYTADGDKTKYATLEEENRALQRELAEVKMERDMLKKAASYFASQQKYIVSYNVKRIQKKLGYMSPREYLGSLVTQRLADAA